MFRYELRLDIHHAAVNSIEPMQCQIALKVPREFVGAGCKGEPPDAEPTSVILSPKERLHIQKPTFKIFPGGWQSVASNGPPEVQYGGYRAIPDNSEGV